MSLMAAMSVVGGNYSLNASQTGEFDTVQRELEFLTSTMYMSAERRIQYGMNTAIPAMTAQLQGDSVFAALYGTVLPDYARARVGAANAAASAITSALGTTMAVLPGSRRMSYLWLAERLTYEAATALASTTAIGHAAVWEAYRKRRDDSLSYLFKDIELATKVRGIGDGFGGIAMASIYSAAKEAIDNVSSKATMAHLEWDRNRRAKSLDSSAFDLGAILGQTAVGIADGYSAAKTAASGGKT